MLKEKIQEIENLQNEETRAFNKAGALKQEVQNILKTEIIETLKEKYSYLRGLDRLLVGVTLPYPGRVSVEVFKVENPKYEDEKEEIKNIVDLKIVEMLKDCGMRIYSECRFEMDF